MLAVVVVVVIVTAIHSNKTTVGEKCQQNFLIGIKQGYSVFQCGLIPKTHTMYNL